MTSNLKQDLPLRHTDSGCPFLFIPIRSTTLDMRCVLKMIQEFKYTARSLKFITNELNLSVSQMLERPLQTFAIQHEPFSVIRTVWHSIPRSSLSGGNMSLQSSQKAVSKRQAGNNQAARMLTAVLAITPHLVAIVLAKRFHRSRSRRRMW